MLLALVACVVDDESKPSAPNEEDTASEHADSAGPADTADTRDSAEVATCGEVGEACDDADACTESDVCTRDGTCEGRPLRCDEPPAAACIDEVTLRTYASAGTCSEGACAYEATDSTCTAGCDMDACVVTSESGDVGWVIEITATIMEKSAVVALPDGDVVAAARVYTAADVDGTAVDPGAGGGVVLVRVGPDGTVRWARALSTRVETVELGAAPDGTIWAGGQATGTVRFAPDTADEVSFNAGSAYETYLVHLTADGTPDRLVHYAGASYSGIDSLAGMNDGGVVVWGYHSGAITLGAGEPNETEIAGMGGDFAGYVARFASDGSLDWAWGPPETDARGRVATEGERIVVLGSSADAITFDNGDAYARPTFTDVFLAELDSAGAVLWTEGLSSAWTNLGGLAIADDGGIVAGGYFGYFAAADELVFSDGVSERTRIPLRGGQDGWVARWDVDGELDWAYTQTTGISSWSYRILDVTALPGGGLEAAGWTYGDTDVDGAGGTVSVVSTGRGQLEASWLSYASDGTFLDGAVMGSALNDMGESVASGGVPVVTATISGAATFGAGEAGEVTLGRGSDEWVAVVGLVP